MSRSNKSSYIAIYTIEVLKYLFNLISPILVISINRLVCTGTFPQILKIARVVPVLKSGDKQDLNNYRPISILPIISKIFEKIVFNQLHNYLDHFNLLNNSQFGFRKNICTSHAIINTLQYIYI